MHKIIYLYRNNTDGISIGRVFDTICTEISHMAKIKKISMKKGGANICQVIKNMFYIWKSREHNCIYHITGSIHYLSLVLPKNRTITTVHDVGGLDNYDIKGIKRFFFIIFFIYTLHHNKYIVCISEFTKQRLLKYIHINEKRIYVIPDAVANEFQYEPKKFNDKCPIILHIGTSKNKNLKRTILAIKDLNIHLRIIGTIEQEILFLLKKYNINYSNIYNIPNERIVQEYKNCDIVNFPSIYEGFGLPVIESQAIGRIVVTSDIEPMKDIAGNGALLVNPLSVKSIRAAYLSIIHDEKKRNDIIRRGLKNVEQYRSSIIASQYMNLYRLIDKQ